MTASILTNDRAITYSLQFTGFKLFDTVETTLPDSLDPNIRSLDGEQSESVNVIII